MRPLWRPLLRRTLALAAGAALLGGCTAGATPSLGGAHSSGSSASAPPGSSPAHTSHSAPKPPPDPWNPRPPSVAALGDSITRGFDACKPLSDCPEVSWATGTRTKVDSVTQRLTATGHSWNLAVSGALVSDLPDQARAAAVHKPALVTVLIGANDACTTDVDSMTSTADFRTDFADTLSYLHRTLPHTQILVSSIPDLRRLWSVGRKNPLGKQIWKLGLCPSMLADADSQSAAANSRRTAVRDRVMAYNSAMGQVCGQYTLCRYDGGAVFDYRFDSDDLSTWDWFHPNESGEAALARILSEVVRRPTPVADRS
ncbi:SGNH/GDSL hydrolase family protein [Streptomyces sp. CA-111067]|uniref:SGNH/GDSL hydrolase family protein n=1 Tax=Streptomyces sp. CA-111067 TaxID=3240046 RepID=UPI003D964444